MRALVGFPCFSRVLHAIAPWQSPLIVHGTFFPEISSPSSKPSISLSSPDRNHDHALSPASKPTRTFAQALNNICSIPLSQLPIPYMKGDAIAVKIPEEDYITCIKSCKKNLHERLLLSKGDNPYKIEDLRQTLMKLWKPLS